jgi:8-oxo-dGTP pyrophosphatase MutT (NUDIX family)
LKQAGVMLVVKDGLILCISRRHDKSIFGLLGGKVDAQSGETPKQAAIRESYEEAGILVNEAVFVYRRMDGTNGIDFDVHCFYAADWIGEPHSSEEGDVQWLTAKEITDTKAAFGDYIRMMLDVFKHNFPSVYIQGE